MSHSGNQESYKVTCTDNRLQYKRGSEYVQLLLGYDRIKALQSLQVLPNLQHLL